MDTHKKENKTIRRLKGPQYKPVILKDKFDAIFDSEVPLYYDLIQTKFSNEDTRIGLCKYMKRSLLDSCSDWGLSDNYFTEDEADLLVDSLCEIEENGNRMIAFDAELLFKLATERYGSEKVGLDKVNKLLNGGDLTTSAIFTPVEKYFDDIFHGNIEYNGDTRFTERNKNMMEMHRPAQYRTEGQVIRHVYVNLDFSLFNNEDDPYVTDFDKYMKMGVRDAMDGIGFSDLGIDSVEYYSGDEGDFKGCLAFKPNANIDDVMQSVIDCVNRLDDYIYLPEGSFMSCLPHRVFVSVESDASGKKVFLDVMESRDNADIKDIKANHNSFGSENSPVQIDDYYIIGLKSDLLGKTAIGDDSIKLDDFKKDIARRINREFNCGQLMANEIANDMTVMNAALNPDDESDVESYVVIKKTDLDAEVRLYNEVNVLASKSSMKTADFIDKIEACVKISRSQHVIDTIAADSLTLAPAIERINESEGFDFE